MRSLFLLLFAAACAVALPCVTNSNGNWATATTWTNCNGGVPGNGDTAKILHAVSLTSTVTIGTSPLDSLTVAPALAAIEIDNTNGTTSNGSLTFNTGAALIVRGSVLWVGGTNHASSLTMNQDTQWTFDQSAASDPTAAFYRNYSTTHDSFTMLRAAGASGHRVIIRGKPGACGNCAPAIWFSENSTGTGTYSSFSHDYLFTDFRDFGSATDTYRSAYFGCYDQDHLSGQQMHMVEVAWYSSSGFDSSGSSGYPCTYTDFNVQFFQSFSSTTAANKGFWDFRPVSPPVAGKARTASYIYLDRGFNSGGGNVTFQGFQTVSYIVADGQRNAFGPSSGRTAAYAPTLDHILIHAIADTGDSYSYGSWSYLLWAEDGGLSSAGPHTLYGPRFSGAYDHVWDRAIWQFGERGSSDTDAFEPWGFASNTALFSHLLILPGAADQRYTTQTINVGGLTATSTVRYDHSIIPFGGNFNGSVSGVIGALYFGEVTPCGAAGSVTYLKNSILWNPNPSPGLSPTQVLLSGGCANINNIVANTFLPAGIRNNDVFGYSATGSQRWTSSVTGCGGVNCTNYNTPYDTPTTGTAPGLNDLHADPKFLWQKQGLSAPGPREWANIKHGADITSGETASVVHFGTTFALFANATIDDTTSIAGLKGLVDEMFTWIYGEWSSTQSSLRGAADDGTDIGASPVISTCPSVYPGSIWPACNTVASTKHFFSKRD